MSSATCWHPQPIGKQNVPPELSYWEDHRDAMKASKLSTVITKATVSATNKSETVIIAAVHNVYFAAKHDLPSSLIPDLNKLRMMQLQHLVVDQHTTYEHNTSISDFQDCIAIVLRENLKNKLPKNGKFSIMTDESTDISVKQNLVSYIRVPEMDQFGIVTPQTYFLGICELYKANAENIFTKVISMLSEKGIEVKKLCSVSTDGAAVMVGSKSGVVTRLNQFVPGVLATHCIAHTLALSCATGADSIPYLVKYQDIMNSIFKFVRYSPKNMATLTAVQSIINFDCSAEHHQCRRKDLSHQVVKF
ncbi:zinc finger protein 862-like [Tachypleus tridentatus]|uniref:zinc finger protein 862-like n=1 Tax=Tachypleus tridentatus TaxID=6853 RepID=UPI003FD64E0C